MEIWIPKKLEIETLLEKVLIRLRKSNNVWEIEEWIDDELSSIGCHVSNRAMLEIKEIKEK